MVSIAALVAMGSDMIGRREILGMDPSEVEIFRFDFLCKLQRRRLKGGQLVIPDAHEGVKAAISKVFKMTWLCCRVHFMRNALAHVRAC